MDPLHIEYLKEILDAEVPVWDDKYLSIEVPFGEFNRILMDVHNKIFEMYEKNTDPNIDQRFYKLIRSYQDQIRYNLNICTRRVVDEEDIDKQLAMLYVHFRLDSFSTVETLKKLYDDDKMTPLIFKGYEEPIIPSESLEQYIVFLRANMMCSVEDCAEFIPHVNLDNEEFSPTYQRILPFIKTVTSGLRTKSAAKH